MKMHRGLIHMTQKCHLQAKEYQGWLANNRSQNRLGSIFLWRWKREYGPANILVCTSVLQHCKTIYPYCFEPSTVGITNTPSYLVSSPVSVLLMACHRPYDKRQVSFTQSMERTSVFCRHLHIKAASVYKLVIHNTFSVLLQQHCPLTQSPLVTCGL